MKCYAICFSDHVVIITENNEEKTKGKESHGHELHLL